MEVLRALDSFGDVLRNIRESKGLTINQLAIYSKVSASLISQIENGKRGTPKPNTIEKLAKGLKVDYGYLMEMAGINDSSKQMDHELESLVILQQLKNDFKNFNINDERKAAYQKELSEWSEILDPDEFLGKIDLADEKLLEHYNFTYKGQPLSEEKVKQILQFIRFVASDDQEGN